MRTSTLFIIIYPRRMIPALCQAGPIHLFSSTIAWRSYNTLRICFTILIYKENLRPIPF